MAQATERFYDRFAPLYPCVHLFFAQTKTRLLAAVNSCAPGDLLEIGVGDGTHLPRYKQHRITAIDLSAGMLARAMRHRTPNVTLLKMDAKRLAFADQSVDYVVMSHVVAVLDDPAAVFAEAARVLRPGGRMFVANHFTPANPWGLLDLICDPLARSLFHFRAHFPLADFERAIGEHWMIERLVHQGVLHKVLVLKLKPR